MGTSARRSVEEAGTRIADRPTPNLRTHLTGTASTSRVDTPPPKSGREVRVRYGETEVGLIARRSEAITDIRPYGIGSRDDQIDAGISKCNSLFERLLEAEDIIERENLYRSFNEYLDLLFDLRSYREREFGQLLVMLLSVTRHTTSEFFSNDHFSALRRVIGLIRKPKIVSADLRDAQRLLSGASFDVFRPMRGVFEDV